MFKIFIVLLLSVVASLAQAADSPDKYCKGWTQRIAQGNKEACQDICPQSLAFDKYNYAKGLKASFASTKGLSQFISYTGRSSIMGAGAEAQSCNLHVLLAHWGDDQFAKVTGKYDLKTRERVIGLLDYSAVVNFKTRFPRTYSLATHIE